VLDGDGKWTCPPAQAVARTYGFNYRIWTSREVDPILLRNIEFLADYFGAEEIEIPVAVTKRLQEVVKHGAWNQSGRSAPTVSRGDGRPDEFQPRTGHGLR